MTGHPNENYLAKTKHSVWIPLCSMQNRQVLTLVHVEVPPSIENPGRVYTERHFQWNPDSQSTTQNLDPDKEFLIRSSFRLGGRIEGAVMPYYVLIFFYTLLPLRSQVTRTRFSSSTPW